MDVLKYDEKGLIPAVVQDFYTKEVLTLAYMNKESLDITIKEGRTCFYSRSRGELWRKGETSGNYQEVVTITSDCDGDALVVQVIKAGPACHTGSESCFYNRIFTAKDREGFSYKALYDELVKRREDPVEGSYTSYLFKEGKEKILKKIGEESSEVIIAAMNDDKGEVIYESADLAYHMMVLLIEQGVSLAEITEELARRNVIEDKKKQVKSSSGKTYC